MLIFTDHVNAALMQQIAALQPANVIVVADANTARLCVPRIPALEGLPVIVIPAGDDHKDLQSLQAVWRGLAQHGATRRSLVVNVGGGMLTDLGGFAAATYKRGLPFINIPTTLLAAVDASVGGKTGINFDGLKNQIGAFCEADAVIISTMFFDTLPPAELASGYAEMLKHGLIDGDIAPLLQQAPTAVTLDSLRASVHVKEEIVREDPHERGLRKALNLGHTIGHAFEELALQRHRPIPHGYAVAYGLVAELVLSTMLAQCPTQWLYQMAAYVKEHYGAFPLDCKDYPQLIQLMRHDKKNASADAINFTLLAQPGTVALDCTATPDQITQSLDIYRDLCQ